MFKNTMKILASASEASHGLTAQKKFIRALPLILFLAAIVLLVIVLHVVGIITADTIFFILAILIIAILTWIFRNLIESDPDPFLLNLTFFAFVGQAIKTSELTREGNVTPIILLLMLVAFLLVMTQVMVLRRQKTATSE